MDMFRFLFGDQRGPANGEPFARDGPYGENCYEGNGIDSVFQHFHSDIQRNMEEIQQQMEDIMTNFGAVEFSSIPHVEFPDASGSTNSESNLRDVMLKTPDGPPARPQIEPPSVNTPSRQPDTSFFGSLGLPRFGPFTSHTEEPKVDRDLDGRASDVLKDLESSRCTECPPVQQDMPSSSFFSGRSVSVRSVQGSDGKMEQTRTVKDSSGRTEETRTRFVDGKMHTVTQKVDDKGNEERIEEFKNMDESDLSAFNRTWNNLQNNPQINAARPEYPADGMPQPSQDSYLGSIFSKVFGFKTW